MIEGFFVISLMGGLCIAVMSAPVGCLLLWQRMAFYGDALAHGALLGVVIGLMTPLNMSIGIAVSCVGMSLLLLLLKQYRFLASDTLLSILSHSALALGVIGLSFYQGYSANLHALLFGDILAVSKEHIISIVIIAVIVVFLCIMLWNRLLLVTLHLPLAKAEGEPVQAIQCIFLLMIAATVAVGVNIVGVLLMSALLIIPAASARPFAKTPERMVCLAIAFGCLSVLLGFSLSWQYDIPTGPAIVMCAGGGFLLSLLIDTYMGRQRILRR